MTRQEFIDDICTWSDLISFCYDEDCDICEDIYSEDSRDDYINEHLVEWAQDYSWEDLYSKLDEIPDGYDYYRLDNYGDFECADDEMFDDYKDEVLEWMDNGGWWEDEEEEEYYEPPVGEEALSTTSDYDEEDLIPIEPEDISIKALFSSCSNQLKSINEANDRQAEAEEIDFAELVAVSVSVEVE